LEKKNNNVLLSTHQSKFKSANGKLINFFISIETEKHKKDGKDLKTNYLDSCQKIK